MHEPGFFDFSEHLDRLSLTGDPLEPLVRHVDFEAFRPVLAEALGYGDRPKGGRPPFDPVMMFKVLVLASMHNLSNERMEFLIRDRLSWLRFLGLAVNEPTPDQKTIWLFREKLTRAGAFKSLFAAFEEQLRSRGYRPAGGQIVDATLIAAPRQRMTREERKRAKTLPTSGRTSRPGHRRRTRTHAGRSSIQGPEGQETPVMMPDWSTSPCRTSATRTTSPSTGSGASSAGKAEPTRPGTTAMNWRMSWTGRTVAARSGPTPHIARRTTRCGWTPTASSPASTAGSRRADPCRNTSDAATPPVRPSAPMWSMSSAAGRGRWTSPSAASAGFGPQARSRWQTSPTTSVGPFTTSGDAPRPDSVRNLDGVRSGDQMGPRDALRPPVSTSDGIAVPTCDRASRIGTGCPHKVTPDPTLSCQDRVKKAC